MTLYNEVLDAETREEQRQRQPDEAAADDQNGDFLVAFDWIGTLTCLEADALICSRDHLSVRSFCARSLWGVPVRAEQVKELARTFPRSYEVTVRGRVKFRIGQIVWLAFDRDEQTMGLGFPKEFRQAAIEAEPDKFFWPRPSDLRFNWIEVRLAALDREEMRDLVEDAWARCAPKSVAADYAAAQGYRHG